jgi:hypothetical protein
MRGWIGTITGLALAVGGCAVDRPMRSPAESEAPSGPTITYETQPCFGACPVYTISVMPDGHGMFHGTRFTAATGDRSFAADRVAYGRFADALAPFRPSGERAIQPGSPDCGPAATDMSSVTVRWSGDATPAATLTLYYGCSAPALAAMKQALRDAPGLLPIAPLIGAKH